MQSENLVGHVLGTDALNHAVKLLQPGRGYVLDPETQKIRRMVDAMDPNSPWIHIRQSGTKLCYLQQHFFDSFKRIPSMCMKCWKIVVMPKTIVQLFDLHDLMEELDYESKCGIERREFVPRNYGGYFYTESKDEGMARYREVREIVSDTISPDVNVILKRYCTEFELQKGPSKAYNQPKDTAHWEKLYFDLFEKGSDYATQPPHLKNHIKRTWIEWAWASGDMTVKTLNNGDPLYTPSDTYHQEN